MKWKKSKLNEMCPTTCLGRDEEGRGGTGRDGEGWEEIYIRPEGMEGAVLGKDSLFVIQLSLHSKGEYLASFRQCSGINPEMVLIPLCL